MRIAHLTCVWPPYPGGIGRVAYEIAIRQAQNHQVEVFTPLYKDVQLADGVTNLTVNYIASPWQVGKAQIVPSIVSKLKDFDIVHLHYPWFGAHEFLHALNNKTKLVITYHMEAKSSGWKQIFFNIDQWLFARRLARRADCLLVATEDYLQNVAQPHFGQANKWQVLPFGVDSSYSFQPPLVELRKKLLLNNTDRVLIFVGVLDKAHEFKGLSVLLQALKMVNTSGLKLVVVGEGDMKQFYIKMASDLGIQDLVKFVGYVPEVDLPSYYNLAETLVFPSVSVAEAFGLVALQAMASGLPVIASDLPGVRQVVQNNISGLLVKPNNINDLAAAINKLLAEPDLVKKMGSQGRQDVLKNYQWDGIVNKLEQIYKSL